METLNFVNERKGHEKAVMLLEQLEESAHYRLPPTRRGTVGMGRAMFRQHTALSLGDAMQVAFAKNEDIEYVYSFDDDFDGVDGVTEIRGEIPRLQSWDESDNLDTIHSRLPTEG